MFQDFSRFWAVPLAGLIALPLVFWIATFPGERLDGEFPAKTESEALLFTSHSEWMLFSC